MKDKAIKKLPMTIVAGLVTFLIMDEIAEEISGSFTEKEKQDMNDKYQKLYDLCKTLEKGD